MTRTDGRAAGELRPTKVTPGFLAHAEGSVLIEVGRTRVICAATVEDRVPPFLRNSGKGWVTAEYGMLPRATSTRTQREATAGKVGGRTQEIQRLIGRSLRSVTKLTELGERTIWIDCDVIQADGGTRTASITGGFVALALALQRMRDLALIRDVPLIDYVAATSVGIVDGVRAARSRVRRGLARRGRHELRQDRRRPLHRAAGDGGGQAVRQARARRADVARRQRHQGADRDPGERRRGHREEVGVADLLIATTNPGKIREILGILDGVPASLVTLADRDPIPEPDETGATFAENARLKALYYAGRVGAARGCGRLRPGNRALDNAPGVHSARWHGHDYAVKFQAIYRELERRGLATSPARFVAHVTLAHRGQVLFEATGRSKVRSRRTPRGVHGFGYDPSSSIPPTA